MSLTQPDAGPVSPSGADAHFRALEKLYASAPINLLFRSSLTLSEAGRSRIDFTVEPASFHAAGAAHGTLYFKMLDDAAFYAANSLVSDRFLLTTAFNLHFTKPMRRRPGDCRRTLDLGQATGLRRRSADRRFERRGMRARDGYLSSLAHRAGRARRLLASMSEPRLAAGVEASALLARARDVGGFGTIIRARRCRARQPHAGPCRTRAEPLSGPTSAPT